MIKELIKQLLCPHKCIDVTTETDFSVPLLIVKTLIQCKDCKKSFSQHPHMMCCYVAHLHNEILRDKFIEQYKRYKQP